MPDVPLRGCTPEPLMNYLKALGIFRLVAEDRKHGDAAARGYWRDDVFVLRSRFDETALETFFLEHYRPTPIVAPWAGGSGFFKKDNKQAVEALLTSSTDRVARYRETIRHVRTIIDDEQIGEKPKDEDKVRLIRRYRRELPDEVVSWMDTAMVLQHDGQSFAPLLGTGGNDGRLDFTQNFMQRLVLLRLHEETPASQSREWLRHALFGLFTRMNRASVGQCAPGRAGGPNATQGMEGDSADNPWDFVLMLEGSLVMAGAAVRRLDASSDGRAAFPFTVRAADVGFASAGRNEAENSRGELWLPLWNRPILLSEAVTLFGEGRAEVNGRRVRDSVGFARAAATLGVDRGITTFARFSLLRRSGKAFLATPAGRIAVREERNADLLLEIDPWLESFRRACSGDSVPPRFPAALRAIHAAIFDFCRYGGAVHFRSILVALGAAERVIANSPRFRENNPRFRPLAGLSAGWLAAARGTHATAEFDIALSLAGIGEHGSKVGPLRSNLEPVTTWDPEGQPTKAAWAEESGDVVWNASDLSANLAAVLARRIMDGERKGCKHLPLATRRDFAAPPAAIASFLRNELAGSHIEELIWGLMLVDHGSLRKSQQPRNAESFVEQVAALSPIYCLLKLLLLPRDLVVSRKDNKTYWNLASDGEKEIRPIRPEPAVLALLRAGRIGEAAAIAMRRLRASGLTPLPHRRSGGTSRDHEWSEIRSSPRHGEHLCAALLIPIEPSAVNAIVHRATRGDDFEISNEWPDDFMDHNPRDVAVASPPQ